jgi:hypothetical protein
MLFIESLPRLWFCLLLLLCAVTFGTKKLKYHGMYSNFVVCGYRCSKHIGYTAVTFVPCTDRGSCRQLFYILMAANRVWRCPMTKCQDYVENC